MAIGGYASNGLLWVSTVLPSSVQAACNGVCRLPIRNGVYTQSHYPWDQLFRVFYPWSTGSLPDTEVRDEGSTLTHLGARCRKLYCVY